MGHVVNKQYCCLIYNCDEINDRNYNEICLTVNDKLIKKEAGQYRR